ncbi:hypothetical protein [Gillisia sp. JM1]|uniref:hypothetical protein n=1 Tax=Gillisia sp. JM1 TaxID=1283286 RepID=UPI0003F7B42F|nr:hypothetical protein [Gillisia sp. JM1]
MKSYKDLDVYNLAFTYAVEVHKISLKQPKFELYYSLLNVSVTLSRTIGSFGVLYHIFEMLKQVQHDGNNL